MPNLYGVANAPNLPYVITVSTGSDVAIPANTVTNVIVSGLMTAPSGGYFYADVIAGLIVAMGATPPGSVGPSVAIGAGSAQNGINYGAAGFVGNGTYYLTYHTFSASSQVAWQGAGSTITLAFYAATQACTIKAGSWMTATLMRAPDQ